MANNSCKFIISCCIFVLLVCLDIASHGLAEGRNRLDEIRLLLKAKGTIKTIESPEDGVVIDCIDFWKQPAFDNPITKKHELMKPTKPYSNIYQMRNESQKPKMYHKWNKYGECPKGTIPRRRTRSNNSTIHRHKHPRVTNDDGLLHEYAIVRSPVGVYNGASAILNIWNPYVEPETLECSVAQIWVASNFLVDGELNTIEAGWMVNPNSETGRHDTETTLFIYWTRDSYAETGCRNTFDCPGFVQTAPHFSFDCAIQPASDYDGEQYEIRIDMERDPGTCRWYLYLDYEEIGYWPPNIFTTLGDGSDEMDFGGEIINDRIGGHHTITEMGSGHFPNQGLKKAAYFRSLEVKDENHNWCFPHREFLSPWADHPRCYDVKIVGDGLEMMVFYGGPGGHHCDA